MADDGQLLHDILLELLGSDAREGAAGRKSVHLRQAPVIAIDLALLGPRVADDGALTLATADQALETEAMLVRRMRDLALSLIMGFQDFLGRFEDMRGDDRLVLAGKLGAGPRVGDDPDIRLPLQGADHGIRVEGLSSVKPVVFRSIRLAPQAHPIQLLGHPDRGPVPEVQIENPAHQLRLGLVDHENLVLQVISQRRQPRAPEALAGPREVEILRPLDVQLAVVLRELDHDRRHEPPLRALGVDGLRGGNEGDVALLEKFQQKMEVLAVAREPVELVDDDALDLAFLHGFQEAPDGGPLEVFPGLGGIVEGLGVFLPAPFLLNLDEASAAGLLVVDRRDLAGQVFVVGLAGVNRHPNSGPFVVAGQITWHRATPTLPHDMKYLRSPY